jgi:hypothetical protein
MVVRIMMIGKTIGVFIFPKWMLIEKKLHNTHRKEHQNHLGNQRPCRNDTQFGHKKGYDRNQADKHSNKQIEMMGPDHPFCKFGGMLAVVTNMVQQELLGKGILLFYFFDSRFAAVHFQQSTQ